MMHWFVTKKNWKGRKDMRRVKAEKEEMPIFLAKNVTAKGLNLHVGDIVRIYKGNPEKKIDGKSLMMVPIQILQLYSIMLCAVLGYIRRHLLMRRLPPAWR